QHQAAIRQEALELLDRDVDDGDLEAVLRGHEERVVDTAWAEQVLLDALVAARVELPMPADEATADDLDAIAERWLAESPARREARSGLEAELAAIDDRLSVVEEQLADRQADAF